MIRKQPKTIPILLAILILGLSSILGVFLIKKSQTFSLRASEQFVPQQVKITNISDISFTVSWITQFATQGFVGFGETPQLGQISLDDQDKGMETKQTRFTHYVTLENLKPATKYFFKINSGGKFFDNSGKLYEVTTASNINLPLPSTDTAYGIILEPGGNPAKGAIVYLSLANTTSLSSMAKNDGSWMISLSMARTLTLTSYSSYDKELQVEEIFVQGGSLGTATAIITTKNDSPVPTLTLGQTYDFRQVAANLSPTSVPLTFGGVPTGEPTSGATPIPTTAGSRFSLESLPTPTSSGVRLNILNPSEGEKVNTQKPEFVGTAPAGEILQIVIQSETNLSGQTLVDKNGNWQWNPPNSLSPGQHTVTAILKDKTGVVQKVTRNFTVLAVGETNLPSFTSTPSAGLLTPTPEPTRIITTPTEPPEQPKSGNLTTTTIFFTIGLAFLILGFYQFKWTSQ